MTTISTTTNGSPFAYPGNTLVDRATYPRLFALVKASTSNTYEVWKSDNEGTTWTLYQTTTRASIVDSGSIFVSNNNFLWWVYRTNESSQDRIYLRRLNLYNAVWDSEVLVALPGNGGVGGSVYGGLDLQLVVSAGQIYVAIAVGSGSAATCGVTVFGVYYDAAGAPHVTYSMVSGTNSWTHAGTGRVGPSVDLEHNGDGKSSAAPHLWITFGRDRLLMVKCAWNGSGWSGPSTAQEMIASGMTAREYTTGRYDGQRWLMAVPNPTTGLTDTVRLVERNQANTTTIERVTPPHTTGVIRHCGLSYNAVTGDTRVYAIGTSTTVLYYTDFVRQSGTWTSWATVLATAVLGSSGQEWGVRRGSTGNAHHDVYTAHSGSPNTLTHTAQTLTYAPFTPAWEAPVNGAAADVASALLLDWAFSDPDPADTQSAYALSRQIGAGSLSYFRASDQTWQAAEVKNTSGTTSRSLAASWGSGSDANHSYKVKVWDSADVASGYSDAMVVVPSTVVNPTVSTPTPAQVLTGNSVTVTWTVAEQTAYRVTLSITAGAQLHDSGWVAGSALTYTPPVVLLNGGAYTVTLETRNNEGLGSAQQTRNVTVSYLAPDTPTLVCTAVPASGWISVAVTNPGPTGGRPTVVGQDVYRRPVGDTSDGVRLAVAVANGGTFADWKAVSGVSYEYRVLASGNNGTSVYSAWTT